MAPKAKKNKDKEAKAPVGSAAAEKTLQGLIAEKRQSVGDGSLQVIIAIASTTALVTVDLTTSPPRTKPANLGALTFNDPAVGLSNMQMAIFKGNLAVLLPQIAADVARIPENAALRVGDVAEFVRLALLTV